jgi:glutamate-1-semialdehyde aminotransferase
MALTRTPVFRPEEFHALGLGEKRTEIRKALKNAVSAKLRFAVTEEGHVFVPCGEDIQARLESLRKLQGVRTRTEAISRAVSNYITGKNLELVDVAAHTHEGARGFRVSPKKI